MSILVAEDNEANQKVLMKMLERLGYNSVVTANNGQIALEKVRKRQNEEQATSKRKSRRKKKKQGELESETEPETFSFAVFRMPL